MRRAGPCFALFILLTAAPEARGVTGWRFVPTTPVPVSRYGYEVDGASGVGSIFGGVDQDGFVAPAAHAGRSLGEDASHSILIEEFNLVTWGCILVSPLGE